MNERMVEADSYEAGYADGLAKAEAENERLRQALAYVAAYDANAMGVRGPANSGVLYGFAFGAVQEHARHALAGEEKA